MSQSKSQFAKVLFVTTALIAVAACSSDRGTTTDATVTPPVTVVTPPAAQLTLATEPVGTSLSVQAQSFTFTNGAQASAETAIPAGTLQANAPTSYVTTSNGFTLTLPDGQPATFVTTGGTSTAQAAEFTVGSVKGTSEYQAQVTGGTNTVNVMSTNGTTSPLTYATYGMWAESVGTNAPITAGTYATGVTTTSGQMPTTGTATYSGHLTGFVISPNTAANITDGAVSLNANFGSNTVNGGITGITTVHGGNTPINGQMNDITLAGGTISNGGFAGTAFAASATSATSINVAGANGTYAGKFYGPGAAEAAGNLSLSGGGSTVVGAFGAKKP